ncbi:MAG TPA: PilX N-terminal domain-containing pilus assembly protein [Candidatus Limnocylindria bacterium]|nr:PilX N-terminal domain-containing pilus assembly protein [Candidatus Limnocylindria bacterium]
MRAGFVLPACLILLVALALIATGAMQASAFESRMAGNAVERADAFAASESVRRLFEPVLHAALDGDAAALDVAAAGGWTLTDPTGVALATNDDEAGQCATPFTTSDDAPCTLRIDATYERNVAEDGEPQRLLRGEIAVFRMRTDDAGVGYFYVESRGASANRTDVRAVTAAIVRHVPVTIAAAEGTEPVTAPPGNGEIDWRERRP